MLEKNIKLIEERLKTLLKVAICTDGYHGELKGEYHTAQDTSSLVPFTDAYDRFVPQQVEQYNEVKVKIEEIEKILKTESEPIAKRATFYQEDVTKINENLFTKRIIPKIIEKYGPEAFVLIAPDFSEAYFME